MHNFGLVKWIGMQGYNGKGASTNITKLHRDEATTNRLKSKVQVW